MSDKILIVDDEVEIADLIELYLTNENYIVYKFYTAREALKCIESTELDLAILDIMLPDMNGFALCQQIREQYTYPVIMLTAKDAETDKITGLTLGADDYITKPFRPLEMVARVKAQLRRYKKYNPSHAPDGTGDIIAHSGLVMNVKTHECTLDDQPLILTPTEFSLLRILLENKGNVVSAEELFHGIWEDEYYSKSNNTITVHIRHLREKMHDTVEHPKYIKTIWGVGYKIETSI
ncbi:MAG: VanR-ABDEGLN family response regulator transcription factor [Acetatifactor muris]|nr:VanR-ABDEGLN family response regulator transcription factor [Acetatifactor muris]MCM1525713.1 VanR-ABDEGLN family response regulator transcription factor [Bacteroides sp.]